MRWSSMRFAMSSVLTPSSCLAGFPERTNSCMHVRSKATGRYAPEVGRVRVRVGVFGGTFNPPHLGHLICAQEAYIQLELDMGGVMGKTPRIALLLAATACLLAVMVDWVAGDLRRSGMKIRAPRRARWCVAVHDAHVTAVRLIPRDRRVALRAPRNCDID